MDAFLAPELGEELDLGRHLHEAAEEMAIDSELDERLQVEVQKAESGLRRLADAVASGALDGDAARHKTPEGTGKEGTG